MHPIFEQILSRKKERLLMNIDELTLGQLKQIQSLLATEVSPTSNAKVERMRKVIVRADSGVYYATIVSRHEREVELKDSRHIHQWGSVGLSRKVLNCEDIASIGLGTDTRISGAGVTETVLDVRAIIDCTPEAVKVIENLPAKP